MPPPLAFRAAFRRQLNQLRMSRLPPRRFQSSNPGPKPKPAKPIPAETPIPVGGTPVPPVSLWLRLGPLTRAGQAYARVQRTRPWATQVASALVIYLAADISAQRIGGKEYVPERTVRNLVIGGVCAVPNFLWFVWLSQHFNYPSHILSIGVKIVVNQLVFTPTFNSYCAHPVPQHLRWRCRRRLADLPELPEQAGRDRGGGGRPRQGGGRPTPRRVTASTTRWPEASHSRMNLSFTFPLYPLGACLD
ncbi:hypothetical protein F4677DRAFT_183867 [Hypoxylon crocopeplum]|nr:hypothetical protein F4677DRAFT_183867 [Hypoxylon crocopeplum]